MSAKQTEVELQRTADNAILPFEINHAERLLRMPNSGWRLPDTSSYTFDSANGIGFKEGKRRGKQAEQIGNDSESSTASE